MQIVRADIFHHSRESRAKRKYCLFHPRSGVFMQAGRSPESCRTHEHLSGAFKHLREHIRLSHPRSNLRPFEDVPCVPCVGMGDEWCAWEWSNFLFKLDGYPRMKPRGWKSLGPWKKANPCRESLKPSHRSNITAAPRPRDRPPYVTVCSLREYRCVGSWGWGKLQDQFHVCKLVLI